MEANLKDLGFEVIKRINAGKKEMEQAIMEFSQKLPTYNVALFYYAGHGVQVEVRSNGIQRPRESSGLRGGFYFKK